MENTSASPRREGYRLTPIQQGMLVEYLKAPHSGVNVEQMVARLREPLNGAALRRAWEHLTAAHAVLRTSIEWEHLTEPLQFVHDAARVRWQEQDLRGLPSDVQTTQIESFLRDDRRAGFDPRLAPLSRCALFRMADAEWTFVWTFHHMLADGQSYPLLVREAFETYEQLKEGRTLTQVRVSEPSHRMFVDWLWSRQASLAGRAQVFWAERLAGFTAPTPLPFQSGLPAPAETRERFVRLSTEHTRALGAFAEEQASTIATMVQAAWALVLSRMSGETDVVFGVTRAGRRGTVPDADRTVGSFINTIPVRVAVHPDTTVADWLRDLRAQSVQVREFEHTPLVDIQRWSDVPSGGPLFESLLVYTPRLIGSLLSESGASWANREVTFVEQTAFPVTLFAYGEPELLLKLAYDPRRLTEQAIDRWLGQLETILLALPHHAGSSVGDLPVLSTHERQLLATWNDTTRAFDRTACVHDLFEQQVRRTPDQVAIIFRAQSLTYRELNARANRVAQRLRALGVGPDRVVAILADRSIDMVVGLLGILKAGGAYLPMDPGYPPERLTWMLEDTAAAVLLTEARRREALPPHKARVVLLDSPESASSTTAEAVDVPAGTTPDNLAYVIFTSGSTGRPKGVMVQHGNVTNFFAGMDDQLRPQHGGVWLAVTSISFDISVLELFLTLTRGFTVVIQEELEKVARGAAPRVSTRGMQFSLFYFSADAGDEGDRYRLLLEGARYADTHGFSAVWTPERHFHPFGGLYPNPAVTSAAVAAVTSRVQIRAGSVVLPLHDPIRVAEEWAVVDNLSRGRVGLSFASGWHVNDFALMPNNYQERRQIMAESINKVQQLWRGEAVPATNGQGQPIEVRVFPRPFQTKPPIWITSAGNVDSFRMAGQLGANLLTNLLGQTVEDLSTKVATYREARRAAGHAGRGHVSLMLHTFVGADVESVREIVRKPFIEYLKTSTELVKQARWEFPAFAANGRQRGPVDNSDLSDDEMDALLDHAFERYFGTSGLFGTPDSCREMVDRLEAAGVDEIACLLDFGVATDTVLEGLVHLNQLRARSTPSDAPDYSIPAQLVRHGVTHFQCTPSLIRALLAEPHGREALSSVEKLLLGGEALPPELAAEVRPLIRGDLLNMYGPTETTVWSTVAAIGTVDHGVTIGRPIANTQIHLVDRHLRLVPVGAPGELLIGGEGVARGYWNRPDLTEERFVPDVFGGTGGRIYRTGDLARYRDDGQIDFLGRLDHQVKIRGHRIELGEIEGVLDRHPAVERSVVVVRADGGTEPRLVAYVVPKSVTSDGSLDADRWQRVWDETYRGRSLSVQDATFDTTGWRSSYTGERLPDADMREWVDETVARILECRPRRVLEVGCGTGLLLFRVAPRCATYTGLDFSMVALERLAREVEARGLTHVSLVHGRADALGGLDLAPVDLVVINSVAQYFPGVEYFVRVLEQASRVLAPGGMVLIGDVRHLGLLEAFHVSVEAARASADTPVEELKRRSRERAQNDAELIIAPEFFHAVRAHLPVFTWTSIRLKGGRLTNEMTKFRYDVLLGTSSPDDQPLATTYRGEGLPLAEVRRLLETTSGTIRCLGLTDRRVARDLARVNILNDPEPPRTVGELNAALDRAGEDGLNPHDLIGVSSAGVVLTCASPPGTFDATFPRSAGNDHAVMAGPVAERATSRPWTEYVHRPRFDSGELVHAWKRHLRDAVPAYMMPAAFVVLESFPLTPNGKVDRKALPEPDRRRTESAAPYVAPVSDLEQVVASVWQELLNLDRVSARDNFFDLGANSLLMVQAHTALRDRLQQPLSLVDLFRFPTVSTLAEFLRHRSGDAAVLTASQARAQSRLDAANRRRQGRQAATMTKP